MSAFEGTPSPLSADVIYGSPLCSQQPQMTSLTQLFPLNERAKQQQTEYIHRVQIAGLPRSKICLLYLIKSRRWKNSGFISCPPHFPMCIYILQHSKCSNHRKTLLKYRGTDLLDYNVIKLNDNFLISL